jgi:peptidoglycan hydrolase-like protein with peptidoglycan-binding domain
LLFRRFLTTAVAACLIAGGAPAAEAKKPTSKGKKSSRARRAGPPRQKAPSPERFKEFQEALAERGYYTGPINGEWGPESVDALKRFQRDQNLAADGKLGALSIIALGLGPKREISAEISAKAGSSQPE